MMNIEVEYKYNKTVKTKTYDISIAAFIKHLGFAGQGCKFNMVKLIRAFGMSLHYIPFMELINFNKNRFSTPCNLIYDPTEKSHFSNLAGKAIADFLSKKIDNSIFTFNYEALMKSIKRRRGDLIAFTSKSEIFSIEAKGFSRSSVNINNMKNYIKQSKTGGIPVNFSVACVSYNLYNKVKCKYYKSKNKATTLYYKNILNELIKSYYSSLKEFLDLNYNKYEEFIENNEEKFYKIDLLKFIFDHFRCNSFNFKFYYYYIYNFFKYLGIQKVYLILPYNIGKYSENGIPDNLQPFKFNEKNEYRNNLYIDKDRVGILIV